MEMHKIKELKELLEYYESKKKPIKELDKVLEDITKDIHEYEVLCYEEALLESVLDNY